MAVLTLERNSFTVVLAWLSWVCWAVVAIGGPAISLCQGKIETQALQLTESKPLSCFGSDCSHSKR